VPLYEYACLKCGRHTEKIESVSGPHLKKCPHCAGKVERVLAPPAIQFKGSGWYVTDYAGKSATPGDAEKSEKPAARAKEGKAAEAPATESAAKDSSTKENKTGKKK
jgi:putative FmdB family regulatory protein